MSQKSVRLAAKEITTLTSHLDLIINNAGFMSQTRRTTEEGIEGQFGANHVGHFLLTNSLMPLLRTSSAPRVINLTSLGHRISPVRFSDYNITGKDIPDSEKNPGPLPPLFTQTTEDGYNGWIAYGQAKSANILFSIGLNQRGVRSLAVHPGCK